MGIGLNELNLIGGEDIASQLALETKFQKTPDRNQINILGRFR